MGMTCFGIGTSAAGALLLVCFGCTDRMTAPAAPLPIQVNPITLPPEGSPGILWGYVLTVDRTCLNDTVVEVVGGPHAGGHRRRSTTGPSRNAVSVPVRRVPRSVSTSFSVLWKLPLATWPRGRHGSPGSHRQGAAERHHGRDGLLDGDRAGDEILQQLARADRADPEEIVRLRLRRGAPAASRRRQLTWLWASVQDGRARGDGQRGPRA